MQRTHLPAPAKIIFGLQCVDNAMTLLMGWGILASGMSLFSGNWAEMMIGASPSFWLGVAGLLAFCGVFYRVFFFLFWGRTPGAILMGLQPNIEGSRSQAIVDLMLEAFQVALPGLWILDILLRKLDFRAGVRYSFSYELPDLA